MYNMIIIIALAIIIFVAGGLIVVFSKDKD